MLAAAKKSEPHGNDRASRKGGEEKDKVYGSDLPRPVSHLFSVRVDVHGGSPQPSMSHHVKHPARPGDEYAQAGHGENKSIKI